MFHRRETDGTRIPVDVRNLYSAPIPAACWIIGGGPSLSQLDVEAIRQSPAPKFAVNLAGSGLLRPNFWTSYDPTARFHRSIYFDGSILKFVHAGRALDLVPETTLKVCECPGVLLFERDRQRGFHDFPDPTATIVTDWQDSLVQAIDIAFQLGFRELYLAGCEMIVRPGSDLLQRAAAAGVTYARGQLLKEFFKQCSAAGVESSDCVGVQYHFEEQKPREAAMQTDFHYFRVAQYLRLSRRSQARAGLRLVSVTPGSRLNDHFPMISVEEAAERIQTTVGDPQRESTRGRYTESRDRRPAGLGPMQDFPPHFWPAKKPAVRRPRPAPRAEPPSRSPTGRELEMLREVAVEIEEVG